MSYFTWNNNQITTTSDQVTYGDTTILGTCSDKGQGYFLSPVYIATQSVYSFSRNSKLEVVYGDGTDLNITGSVSVGAFSDPNVKTTTYTEITTAITYASDTGTDIGSIINYSGVFRTFPPLSSGRLNDVSILTSYQIIANVSSYSTYIITETAYFISTSTDSFSETTGTGTGSISAPSSTTINTTEEDNPLTIYPSFFGGNDNYETTTGFYTSSTNNRSWAANDLYYRWSNAGSIPASSTTSQEKTITTTALTGISQDSDGNWITSESFYIFSDVNIYSYYTTSYTGEDYIYSFSETNAIFNITTPKIGANVGFAFQSSYIDPNWGFVDSTGGLTNVHAFISPIIITESSNLENIGVANYKNGEIFFPQINKGDLFTPQTQYAGVIREISNDLGISIDGISATWNIPTEITTGATTTWGSSTTSGSFQTSYSAISYETTIVIGGNAQVVYPKDSSGNFEITLTYNGVFGATTFGQSGSSTSIFTATTNDSISASSTTITLQSNQTFQIITDGFWLNQGSSTAIL